MNVDPSLWSFISQAGWVVKFVLLILLCASIASWTLIIQRVKLLKKIKQEADQFEQTFWSGISLPALFKQLGNKKDNLLGLSKIFCSGFQEYQRLIPLNANQSTLLQASQRSMEIASAKTIAILENQLSFLATVGSVSPYIGLFGTVWGIMTAFRSLGGVQQATIAMVAPGIAEALIATAIGLFAAIPAVIAYNRLNNSLERLQQRYAIFQEEFIGILQRHCLTNSQTHEENDEINAPA